MIKPKFIKSELEFKKFIETNKNVKFVDAFLRQIKELFIIENPKWAQNKKEGYESSDFTNFIQSKSNQFVYIYFPWLFTVVKSVKESDYFTLKTNRNINLISPSDQEKLKNLRVAVLGMSVGSNIAHVMTQAGIARSIILADFDELDTTNLNRILGGIHQIGINKAEVAAQTIYERDPFSKITLLTKGVSEKDLDRLLKTNKIDLIVEEVDSMPIKLMVRQKACEYKKPVIMIADNGDGINMAVERYDLGYDKFMNKPFDYWPKKMAECKTPKDFADIVINDMVGGVDKVDPRMMESVNMIFNRKLVSWPQLGSAALLAGVAATITIKNLVRGKDNKKFRRENIFLP